MAGPNPHNPATLFQASVDRMISAWVCWRHDDHALAMYLGGLSVECMLQALAHRQAIDHDARHDLHAWLRKTPLSLITSIQSDDSVSHWNRVVGSWHNGLRYFDRNALLGHVRVSADWRRYRGDDDARIRQSAKEFLQSAEQIQRKGLLEWQRKGK